MKSKLLLLTILFTPPSLIAATVEDHFNAYGTSGPLNTKGTAGNGWTSGWTGSNLPGYTEGSQLEYQGGDPNNLFGPGNGLAHSGVPGAFHLPNPDGVDPLGIATREFQSLGPITWLSAVTIIDTGFPIIGDGQGVMLWLEPNGLGQVNSNYVGIRSDVGSVSGNPEPIARFDGADISNSDLGVTRGLSTFLLARIQLNVTGNSDSLDFWINPDFDADLESQRLYALSGADVFGNEFNSIGLSFSGGLNLVDSIRISDTLEGARGYRTGSVPDTGPTALLLGAGLLGLASFCRRFGRN